MENPEGCMLTLTHNQSISRLSKQTLFWQHRNYVLKMSVNGGSMICGLASWTMQGLCCNI
jgi:hypothetical protein